MSLPRDFLDEVETELAGARRSLADGNDRIAALEELRLVASSTTARLGRPITVFDVIRSARDRRERDRRAALVRLLRG